MPIWCQRLPLTIRVPCKTEMERQQAHGLQSKPDCICRMPDVVTWNLLTAGSAQAAPLQSTALLTLHTSMARGPHQVLAGISHHGQLESLLRKICFHYCLTYLFMPPTCMGGPRILSRMLFFTPCLISSAGKEFWTILGSWHAASPILPAACSATHPTNISSSSDYYKPLVWIPWFSRHLHFLKLFSASRAPENLPHMLGGWWGTVGLCQGV